MQPKTGLGSVAETNRLLGRDAFLDTGAVNPSATNPRNTYTASLTTTQKKSPGQIADDAEIARQNGTTTGTQSNPDDPFNTYRSYLSKYGESLNEGEGVTNARTSLTNIQNDIDKTDLEARREYEAKLDESGMLKSGAQAGATQARRRSNSELADLAVRESAAARTLDTLSTSANAKSNYLKTQAELAKPVQIGDKYYDPTTGKEIAGVKSDSGFELSPGQTRFDSKGNKIASLPSTPSTVGVTRSGGLTYSPQAAAEDSRDLEASRGEDGYVDPGIYQKLYKEWIANGGLLKDFLSSYPPKDYVNPANTNLPKFLMPTVTTVNPY